MTKAQLIEKLSEQVPTHVMDDGSAEVSRV